ncbi:MAG: translational GTPase TypA [Candidatus Aquicultorales bacterium]
MKQADIRNVAIIAHVDHGKTTLVDRMLQAAGVFRENQEVAERVLDSNDLERERGITILSKNISIVHKGVKINVIDTPGHSDFGGEVERVLKMADGVLLIVDAFEGPMPQTRFVLKKALAHGIKPLVVINKIDRPNSRAHDVLDEVFSLFLELEATDDQLDFPVIYTSATLGYARHEPDDSNDDVLPLLDAILEYVPAPDCDSNGPVAMQVATLDYSTFVGRIGIGRIYSGTLREGDKIAVIKNDGSTGTGTVKELYTFESLGRTRAVEAHAGDIAAVVGIDDADIGDMFTCRIDPIVLDPITVEAPTISVVFSANTSPFAGTEGDFVTSRQLKDRLKREAESNITMRIEELPHGAGMKVSGRGVLHLSVLMETMRREGYEFQVARPQVILREEGGGISEPYELAVVDVPGEYAGKVIELMGARSGEMVEMSQKGEMSHLEFTIPSRGLMGLRTKILNATKGEAVLFHSFSAYGPFKGEIAKRNNGTMIAMATAPAAAYSIESLQARGKLFVAPQEKCYEGMIVGEHNKDNDIVVNIAKAKHLTNMRASTAEKTVVLAPPVTFTLEEALEYIEDDELLEVTPESVRLRKRLLTKNEREKADKKAVITVPGTGHFS